MQTLECKSTGKNLFQRVRQESGSVMAPLHAAFVNSGTCIAIETGTDLLMRENLFMTSANARLPVVHPQQTVREGQRRIRNGGLG